MGGGGVPGWSKPPKPFKPRKISLPPGYKRNGNLEEQECGGGKYTGEWKDGHMHGKGEFKFMREGKERGDRYVGEWICSKQHGQGTYYYRNLDRYEGQWIDGLKHGFGTLFLDNGDKYESDWRHGERQGRGRWTGINGNTFTSNDLEALIGTRRPLEDGKGDPLSKTGKSDGDGEAEA
mmetsp:Transcript_12868/g.18659  ORF Transcript_12868/g.18659 Transcript_12868/m.18659 type:complete len:178 (-) Transcript_12868:226-759(-)